MSDSAYDVVLFGATGFTGRQTVRYFGAHAPAGVRWAAAARSREKLERLQAETGAPAIEIADKADAASVDRLASRTRVLLTTAGPFARGGDAVVDACVLHRVDYVDISGETVWVRDLVDRHHARAAAEGTRIVPSCGFDSIPSDLGTLRVATWIRERWGEDTRRVSATFDLRGGLNGGTLATAIDQEERGAGRRAEDVLLLNPPERRTDAERARSAEFAGVRYDPARRVWLAPFFMGPINTRVVRRSNALLAGWGEGYGPEFAYEEAMEHRSRVQAHVVDLGWRGLQGAVRTAAGRRLLARLGPKPGEGPSERTLDRGWFRVRYLAEAASGRRVLATWSARGDPGNRITVKVLCEAALTLATERERLPGGAARGGVLTPATALGLPLLARLEQCGMPFTIGPLES